jgi:hypothetical protein
LALPGTLLGVWNLIAIAAQRTRTAASAAWIQAHGQAQLFGWVGTFRLGISAALMAASLWILNLGCLLRVSSESIAYSAGGTAWRLLPVSALMELTAVLLFVVNLALTLCQPTPAWFDPETVNARLPLYWYVTSFPKTRALLVRAGIRTLERVHDVPRSLTLEAAASAEGVDVKHLNLPGVLGGHRVAAQNLNRCGGLLDPGQVYGCVGGLPRAVVKLAQG